MTGKWIEVFRAGKQTDSKGNTKVWSEQDLDKIVEQYNGGNHEAPIVVGHPEHNSPAFGWVESLKREGKMLLAKLKDVMPEFTDMVKAGTYKKRSISLYPDLTLRHIGFLGGMPPAVKGLADIAFKDGDSPMTFEFGDGPLETIMQQFLQAFRDVFDRLPLISSATSEFKHNDNEEVEMKPEEVKKMIDDALAGQSQQFGDQLKGIAENIKGLSTQFSELQKGQTADREAIQRREFQEYLMTPDMQKRVTEASREAIINHMMSLVGAPEIEFSEGDEKKKLSAVDHYKKQLQALPEVVAFGEHATRDKVGDLSVNGMDAETLARKATEFQEAESKVGRTVSMTEAVNHVKKGGK